MEEWRRVMSMITKLEDRIPFVDPTVSTPNGSGELKKGASWVAFQCFKSAFTQTGVGSYQPLDVAAWQYCTTEASGLTIDSGKTLLTASKRIILEAELSCVIYHPTNSVVCAPISTATGFVQPTAVVFTSGTYLPLNVRARLILEPGQTYAPSVDFASGLMTMQNVTFTGRFHELE